MKELERLSRAELLEIAGRFNPPVPVKDYWTKSKIIGEIMARRKVEQILTEPEQPEQGPQPPEPDPAFEAALQAESDGFSEPVEVPEKPKVGGARPGAGRPKGSTLKEIALSLKEADPNIRAMLRVFFGFRYPHLDFSNEEIDLIALPLSKIAKYHLPSAIFEGVIMAYIEALAGYVMFMQVVRVKTAQQQKPQEQGGIG